ncbi:MAG: YdcF family protein [Flavobacteriales bacterium]|nr:YdcF family protein [Flavobacteriales bacterium]
MPDGHNRSVSWSGAANVLLHRWTLRLAALLLIVMLIWVFRTPLLRKGGEFLIREDPLVHADLLYVLGGSPVERAAEGARLVQAGYAPRAVFTGMPPNELMQLFGIDSSEAGLGMRVAELSGLDREHMESLAEGTSTAEEAAAVRAHAASIGADTIIVVTTEFHSRRVRQVFRKAFRDGSTVVIVRAALSKRYNADQWWRSEEGMIMVNNEYMKLVYYALKH